MPSRLLMGLMNPGKQYHGTRHNAGAAVCEALCSALGVELNDQDARIKGRHAFIRPAYWAERGGALLECVPARLRGGLVFEPLHVVLPNTMMNLSGKCAGKACAQLLPAPAKGGPAVVCVAHDDTSLTEHEVKWRAPKPEGERNTKHNGILSVASSLKGKHEYHRLRVGVGVDATIQAMFSQKSSRQEKGGGVLKPWLEGPDCVHTKMEFERVCAPCAMLGVTLWAGGASDADIMAAVNTLGGERKTAAFAARAAAAA